MSYTPCEGGGAEGCPPLVEDSATCINGTVCINDELYTEPNPYHIPGSCSIAAPVTLDNDAIAAACAAGGNAPCDVTKTEDLYKGGFGDVYPGALNQAQFTTGNFATTTGDTDGTCYVMLAINYEENYQSNNLLTDQSIIPSWADAGTPQLIGRNRFYNFDQTDPVDSRMIGMHDIWFIPVGPTGTAAGNIELNWPGNGTNISTMVVHEICGLDPKNPVVQYAGCIGGEHESNGTSDRLECSLPNPVQSPTSYVLASYAAAHVPGVTGDCATGAQFVWDPTKDEFGCGHTQGQALSCNADVHVAWYQGMDGIQFQKNFENTDGGVNYAPSMMVMELAPCQDPGAPQLLTGCSLTLTNPDNHCHDTFESWQMNAQVCMAIAPGNDWSIDLYRGGQATGASYRIDNRTGTSLRCECISLSDFGCDNTPLAPGGASTNDYEIQFSCNTYITDPDNGIVIESADACAELSHL